jgi:phosphonate transport system substrate-binding protein
MDLASFSLEYLLMIRKPNAWVLLLLLAASGCLGGCGSEEPAKRVDLSKREEITVSRPAGAITYAYLPQYSHTVAYQRHHLLVDYLTRTTGLPIIQVFPDTFDEHMNMVGRGRIDISFSNPFIYVQIADRYGAKAFARIVESVNREEFRGQVICRKDNQEIKGIEDLKGKRLIAVDPSSAGGYLYPLGLFVEHGLRKKDFVEVAFAPGPGGKQEKVVMAVYSGKYDVGTVREGTLALLSDKIDLQQIRVLANSKWYPAWMYAARQGLDPAVVDAIKKALLALDRDIPEHRTILDNADFTAVVPAVDADFDPVRQLAAQVESWEK